MPAPDLRAGHQADMEDLQGTEASDRRAGLRADSQADTVDPGDSPAEAVAGLPEVDPQDGLPEADPQDDLTEAAAVVAVAAAATAFRRLVAVAAGAADATTRLT
jgi:hypothetical protein